MSQVWSMRHGRIIISKPYTGIVVPRCGTLTHTALFFLALLGVASAYASSGGRSGFSGDPTTNAGAASATRRMELHHPPLGLSAR